MAAFSSLGIAVGVFVLFAVALSSGAFACVAPEKSMWRQKAESLFYILCKVFVGIMFVFLALRICEHYHKFGL